MSHPPPIDYQWNRPGWMACGPAGLPAHRIPTPSRRDEVVPGGVPRSWLLVLGMPLLLAALAALVGTLNLRMQETAAVLGQPGLLAASVGALVGLLMAGAGTASLLLMRAYVRLLELRSAQSPLAGMRLLRRVLIENALLGLGALLAGLFLVAFVRMIAQDNSQGAMLPLLSTVVIVDERALLLAFVCSASLVLAWGALPVLRSTLHGLSAPQPKPRFGGACLFSNWRTWVAALVPVVVSSALITGTTLGVRQVCRVALAECPASVEQEVVEKVDPVFPPPVPTVGSAPAVLHSSRSVGRAPRPGLGWFSETNWGQRTLIEHNATLERKHTRHGPWT